MPVLDGLRGLAIALVLAHNVGVAQGQAPTALEKLLYLLHVPGWIGVHLFFVLSGFLITGILLDSKRRLATGEYFRSFYVRRTLRIFPLYYATLLIAFFVAPRVFPSIVASVPGSLQVWYWTYLSNWVNPYGLEVPYLSHFWSLAAEEQFYLVWPLVVLLTSPRRLAWLCAGLAVVALGVRGWLFAHHAPMLAPYQLTVARMDALVLGSAAALAARTPAVMEKFLPYLGRGLAACGAVLLALVPFSHGFLAHTPVMQLAGHSVLAVFFTLLLVFAVNGELGQTRVARALSHPLLRWLGRYSYAIYVIHQPVVNALRPVFHPSLVNPSFPVAAAGFFGYLAVVAATSIAGAVVSWHLFEKRFLALKDALAPRPQAKVGGTNPMIAA
jgi:peptidoglycan/LPS O-acetylase OafA/YrhL